MTKSSLLLAAVFSSTTALASTAGTGGLAAMDTTAPDMSCTSGILFDGACRSDAWFEARATADEGFEDRWFDGAAVRVDAHGRETAILLEVDEDGSLWSTLITSAELRVEGPTRAGYSVISTAKVELPEPTGEGAALATDVQDVRRIQTSRVSGWRWQQADAITVDAYFYVTASGDMGSGTCAEKGAEVEASAFELCKVEIAESAYCVYDAGNMTRRSGPCVTGETGERAWLEYTRNKLESGIRQDTYGQNFGANVAVPSGAGFGMEYGVSGYQTSRVDMAQFQIEQVLGQCAAEAALAKARFLADDCIDEVAAEDPIDPYLDVALFQDEAGGTANPFNDYVDASPDDEFDPDELQPGVDYRSTTLPDGSVVYEYANGVVVHNTHGGAIVLNSADPGYIGTSVSHYDQQAHRYILRIHSITP